MTGSTYRVTVRGRFGTLDEQAQRFLAAEQANHDIFKSAFTSEGGVPPLLVSWVDDAGTGVGPLAEGRRIRHLSRLGRSVATPHERISRARRRLR
jgi:hypothetical protein